MFLLSCASVPPLSDLGAKVRLVNSSPNIKDCKYISQIKGEGTIGLGWTDDKIYESSRNNLKEKAASVGANTVEIIEEYTRNITGEAYTCKFD